VAAERLGLVLGPLVASVVTVTISVQAAFVLEFLLGLVATVSLLRLEPRADNRDTPHDDIRGGYRRAWQLMRSSRVVWEYSLTGFTYSVGTGLSWCADPSCGVPWGGLSSKSERMPLHTPRHPRHKCGGCVLRLSAELLGSGTELGSELPHHVSDEDLGR